MAKQIITFDGEKFKPLYPRIDVFLFAEIMNSTNEEAYNFLCAGGRSPGCFYPEYWTTLEEIVNFYGLNSAYLKDFYARNGIKKSTMKDDVRKEDSYLFRDFLKKEYGFEIGVFRDPSLPKNVGRCCGNAKNGAYAASSFRRGKPAGFKVCVPYSASSYTLYSAKVFLGTAALLKFAHIPNWADKTRIEEIFRALELSSYGRHAEEALTAFLRERRAEEKKAAEPRELLPPAPAIAPAEVPTPEAVPAETYAAEIKITPNGELVIHPQVLASMMRGILASSTHSLS